MTSPQQGIPQHSWGKLMAVCGPALRPGGLKLTEQALEQCAFPQGAVLIDAGCGLGESLKLFTARGFRAIGIDSDPKILKSCDSNAQTILASLDDMPLESNTADGIFCECVLNLVGSRKRALAEFWRVLKDNGLLVYSDLIAQGSIDNPDNTKSPARNDTSLIHKNPKGPKNQDDNLANGSCLKGAITAPEILSLLIGGGFKIISAKDCLAELNSLAAALVWAYGREGLNELCNLGGGLGGNLEGGLGSSPNSDPNSDLGGDLSYPKRPMSYLMVIAAKEPRENQKL
jgi:SAM-dependent methyltransferase